MERARSEAGRKQQIALFLARTQYRGSYALDDAKNSLLKSEEWREVGGWKEEAETILRNLTSEEALFGWLAHQEEMRIEARQ